MNASRSSRRASSNGLLTDAATASRHFAGAGYGPAAAADVVARELQESLGLRILDPGVAQALERQLLGHHLFGQRHRGADRVAIGHFVEEGRALELGGRHRGARDDHVERGFQSDGARQALRAAGAGQQAQLHFGQCDLRVRFRHAVVGPQRQFEPAAHAHAGDRGDHRFGRIFEGGDHRRQARLARGIGGAELLDVGAAGKSALAAGDDDGLDVVVGQRAVQCGQQVGSQRGAETIDGRVVEGDDGGAAANVVAGAAHGRRLLPGGAAPGGALFSKNGCDARDGSRGR